jgi:hypothetical protein
MAGTYVGMYDTTAANNTATGTGSVSIAEGMAPSNVNNAMRDIMADIRQWYNAAEWIEYGDGAGTYTPAQTSGTQFTIASVDVTAAYHVGRRVMDLLLLLPFQQIQQLQFLGIQDHYLVKP